MIDWSGVEAEFRGSDRSIREIARSAGVTEGAIRKRAKAHGWVRGEPEAATVDVLSIPTDLTPAEIAARGHVVCVGLLMEIEEADRKAATIYERARTIRTLASAIKTLTEVAVMARGDSRTPVEKIGKKEAQRRAAETAGDGTEWGDDLTPRTGAIN